MSMFTRPASWTKNIQPRDIILVPDLKDLSVVKSLTENLNRLKEEGSLKPKR